MIGLTLAKESYRNLIKSKLISELVSSDKTVFLGFNVNLQNSVKKA